MATQTIGSLMRLDDVQSLWNLRYQAKIPECHEAYLGHSAAVGVPAFGPLKPRFEMLLEKWKSTEIVIDFLLLETSFLRRKLLRAQRDDQIKELRDLMAEHSCPPHFQFHFQEGLNALVDANYSKALEQFLLAKPLARNNREFHFASLNAIGAMDALGYSYERPLAKFAETFLREKEDWAPSLNVEYLALLARSSFRTGDLRTLSRLSQQGLAGSQNLYFLSWLRLIPYLDLPKPDSQVKESISRLASDPHGYLTPYRVRTLSFLLVPEDLKTDIKISARIERLYLWVWRWLCAPEPNLLDKIVQLRNQLNWHEYEHLTEVSYYLLRNSLGWLALFSSTSLEHVEQSVAPVIRCFGTPAPILEYEKTLLDYLFALRDGNKTLAQDTAAVLRARPLANQRAFLLPALLNGNSAAPLATLCESVASIRQAKAKGQDPNTIFVNSVTQEISVRTRQKATRVRSSSLATFLSLFEHRAFTPVEDALKLSFGISKYDSLIHDPKIANLLSRANHVCQPFVSFSRRGSIIHIEGKTDSLRFVGTNPHAQQMSHNFSAKIFNLSASPASAPSQSEPVTRTARPPSGWVSRRELEAFLGISSSSALRQIRSWLSDNLLQKRGVGKSSRYFVTQNLESKFLSRLEKPKQSKEGMYVT